MRQAFTLVELAIVLVIIGLLVGGVLVGQDLIKSAAINATVSDIQSYTAAALTFRDKYAGIPGDLRNDKAAKAGLTASTVSPGTYGEGDGDGLLQNGAGGVFSQPGIGGETSLFWRQLSDAGLVAFTSAATGGLVDTTSLSTTAGEISILSPLVPKSRLRDTVFIHAFGLGGVNYYGISDWTCCGTTNGGLYANNGLTAREALGIDTKLDDSMPATGGIISIHYTLGTTAPPPPQNGGTTTVSNTVCYSTTTGTYATSSSAMADNIRCSLRATAGF